MLDIAARNYRLYAPLPEVLGAAFRGMRATRAVTGLSMLLRAAVAGLAASSCSAPTDSSEPLTAPGTFSAVFTGALTDSIAGRAVLAPGDYQLSGIPATDGTVPYAYLIVNAAIGQVRSRSGTLTVLRAGSTQFAGRAEIDAAAEPAFTQNATRVRLRFNASCGELYRCP